MKRLWSFLELLGEQDASKGGGFKGMLGYSKGKNVSRAAMCGPKGIASNGNKAHSCREKA